MDHDDAQPNLPTERVLGRGFGFLVGGQIIALFGTALLRFVLSLYVLDLTGRADVFATIYAVSSLPLLLSPVGGAIADRVNRRNLLVGIAIANAVITASLIALFWAGDPPLVAIAAIMVVLGGTAALEMPTVMACVPSLAAPDKLAGANGLINAISALAAVVAPVLGGVAYGTLSLRMLLGASCAAFLAGAVMEFLIRLPRTGRPSGLGVLTTLVADLKEGFAYVVTKSSIWKCVVLAAVMNFVVVPLFVVGVPIILRQTMAASDGYYGLGMAITESGMILGALSLALVAGRLHLNTLYRWVVGLAIGLTLLAIPLTPWVLHLGFLPSFIGFFAIALPLLMALSAVSIFVVTNVQLQTPDNLLGKVMAIVMAVAQVAAPLGQVLYGFVSEAAGSAQFVPVAAVGILTLGIALFCRFLLRTEGFDAPVGPGSAAGPSGPAAA